MFRVLKEPIYNENIRLYYKRNWRISIFCLIEKDQTAKSPQSVLLDAKKGILVYLGTEFSCKKLNLLKAVKQRLTTSFKKTVCKNCCKIQKLISNPWRKHCWKNI